jgi:mannose-6-phosphate isomerase-like protein (cupin superfamily)
MKKIVGILGSVVASVTLQAADPPGFAIWKAADLRSHDTALSTHVADDHSSRETLADYGDHRFRMLYRDADGNPEQHDAIIDVVMVHSGEGTLQLGGVMAGKRMTSAGESLGTRLDGGDRHRLGPGDIVHIPAGVPHAFLVPQGKHLTYVLLKIPAARQK